MTLSIATLWMMIFSITNTSIATLSIAILSMIVISMTNTSIATLSMMMLSISTLCMMVISITTTRHNETQHSNTFDGGNQCNKTPA